MNVAKEINNLYNPAFCALVIHKCIEEYQDKTNHGLPYPLCFLILPIILDKKNRESLPGVRSTLIYSWIQNNPEVSIDFDKKVKALISITKSAILFGHNYSDIQIDEKGDVYIAASQKEPKSKELTDEVKECISKSKLLGRLFANAGSTKTIFTFLGIKP